MRLAHLPVRYVWLTRWTGLRKESDALAAKWPLPDSRQQVADEWMRVAKGEPNEPWTTLTRLNEGGLTPERWIGRVAPAH